MNGSSSGGFAFISQPTGPPSTEQTGRSDSPAGLLDLFGGGNANDGPASSPSLMDVLGGGSSSPDPLIQPASNFSFVDSAT